MFLLLLCNDRAVLGPWVNGRWLNLFTGAVIWVLVMLSIVLTAATCSRPVRRDDRGRARRRHGVRRRRIRRGRLLRRRRGAPVAAAPRVNPDRLRALRANWRMPPLDMLPAPKLSLSKRIWMGVLRAYLVAAVILVAVKVVQLALGQ